MIERVVEILSELVAFDTVSSKSNLAIIDYIETHLLNAGAHIEKFPSTDGTKAAIWATIGPKDIPGIVLSAHTDVFPIANQAWDQNPFSLVESAGRLVGRGTCDMKGFIAVCLAVLPQISSAHLRVPIHFSFSYDEEVGIVGVRPMLRAIAERPVKPFACIVGEATEMQLAIGHKGKRAETVIVTGRACHSSLAPEGVNAIMRGSEIISYIESLGHRLAETGARDPAYSVPFSTTNVSPAHGGIAISSIPDEFTFTYEFRVVPGDDPEALISQVHIFASKILSKKMRPISPDTNIRFEPHTAYPGLDTDTSTPVSQLIRSIIGDLPTIKMTGGTEAGLFQSIAGIPSVIIGPGSTEQCHQPHEYVERTQLEKSLEVISRLVDIAGSDDVLPFLPTTHPL